MGEKCSVLLQLGQRAALVVPVEGGGGKEPEVVLVGVAIEGMAVPRELDLERRFLVGQQAQSYIGYCRCYGTMHETYV